MVLCRHQPHRWADRARSGKATADLFARGADCTRPSTLRRSLC